MDDEPPVVARFDVQDSYYAAPLDFSHSHHLFVPSVDARFSQFDAAVRMNRFLFLNGGNPGYATAEANVRIPFARSAPFFSIGNIFAPSGSFGPVMSQIEILNSTIIQTK